MRHSGYLGWVVALVLGLWVVDSLPAQAQNRQNVDDKADRLGKTVTQRWQVGAKINAVSGPCKGLFITIPVPTEWAEQEVKVIEEDFTRNVNRVKYRVIDGGVKQMLVSVPRLPQGQEARAVVTFEVTTHALTAPEKKDEYQRPARPPRAVKKFLGNSPFINARNRRIRDQARELVKDKENAWKQVEALYDWVRDNVEQKPGELKGAHMALRNKVGCGEDLVNLFIALCRAHKVPARTVWVQGHFYAEFYLEDKEGKGFWFPCQVVGNREFGAMSSPRPILQKGDNIKVPELKESQRFVAELVKGKGGSPRVTFVRELLPTR